MDFVILHTEKYDFFNTNTIRVIILALVFSLKYLKI